MQTLAQFTTRNAAPDPAAGQAAALTQCLEIRGKEHVGLGEPVNARHYSLGLVPKTHGQGMLEETQFL